MLGVSVDREGVSYTCLAETVGILAELNIVGCTGVGILGADVEISGAGVGILGTGVENFGQITGVILGEASKIILGR